MIYLLVTYTYIYIYLHIHIVLHNIIPFLLEMQLVRRPDPWRRCQEDQLRIKSAMAWVMLAQGIPIVYYGTEQNLLGHQPKATTGDED